MKADLERGMRHLLVPAVLAGVLAGCASAPQQHGATATAAAVLSPELRADFDAALQLAGEEKFEKATELLNRVASQSQNNAVPLINLAMLNAKAGKLNEAEENLQKALQIDPDNPVANNELGILHRRTGRFAEARQIYENVLARYPDYPAANRNLAILCDLYLRDYACALKGYAAYSRALPDDKNARIWLADMQKRVGAGPRTADRGSAP